MLVAAPGPGTRARPVVCDVALFYGARSGGIRTYLDEKARYADRSGAFEHHIVVPGRRELHEGGHHELRSLTIAASTGYRMPFGAGALKETLRRIRPDFVILHDPYWRPAGVTREAHKLGARVVAVHHATVAHNAAGIPGPDTVYQLVLRRIYRHAYEDVDAVMSAVDPEPDTRRQANIPLRFGVHPAFRPGPAVRGDHLLYVGRLSLEKHIPDLLHAVAAASWEPELRLVGDGPSGDALARLAEKLGIADRVRFDPFVADRHRLARIYREAACVVAPGPYETFGLTVLEAAASGARVVACDSTPAAHVAAPLVETFEPKNPVDLLRAIERALDRPGSDVVAAAALADELTWDRSLERELEELEQLRR